MGLFNNSPPMCSGSRHCSQWAWSYMKYCLCNAKDGVSLTLGLVSVATWGFAEIPQIITNYREKSTEGLSLAFLMTWVLGDIFNLSGCLLEPATLPTQYYMAVMYTITSSALVIQTIYYGHIYPQLKFNRRLDRIGSIDISKGNNNDSGGEAVDHAERWGNGVQPSSPIPVTVPALPRNNSALRESYYTSARSLSKSHTPPAGSSLAQKAMPTSVLLWNPIEEPLLGEHNSAQSTTPPTTKTILCVVFAVTFFLSNFNLHLSANNRLDNLLEKPNKGYVIQVGRTLLEVSGREISGNAGEGNSGIGTLLGWGMAAIYMGGRLPQICLNIKRGNVEGLNPLMFIFALVGNGTYVASILVKSLKWSKLRPNLPWLVDAGGCMLLDTFILIQFIYFRYRASQDKDYKHGNSNAD